MGQAGSGEGQGACSSPRLVLCLLSFSALHHAALNGNTELITLLLEAQAAVDIKDNKGKPAPGPQGQGQGSRAGWGPCSLDGCDLRPSRVLGNQGCILGQGSAPNCPAAPRHAASALRSLARPEGAHEAGAEGRLGGERPVRRGPHPPAPGGPARPLRCGEAVWGGRVDRQWGW